MGLEFDFLSILINASVFSALLVINLIFKGRDNVFRRNSYSEKISISLTKIGSIVNFYFLFVVFIIVFIVYITYILNKRKIGEPILKHHQGIFRLLVPRCHRELLSPGILQIAYCVYAGIL